MAQEVFEKMKKYLIVLVIIMFASFLMSGLFFFSSGIFSFEDGDLDEKVVISIVLELERFGVHPEIGGGTSYYGGKNYVHSENDSAYP